MHKIFIRPSAQNDIKKIWFYSYRNWGEKQADEYSSDLGKAIQLLVKNPQLGTSIAHVRRNYRLLHHRHHLIIYLKQPQRIEIVRVLGERMDVTRHLSDKN